MRGKAFFKLLFILLLSSLAPAVAAAQETGPDVCLACHSDKALTTQKKGRTVSLFLDGKKFDGSVHAPLGCTACHADLEGKEMPHEAPLAKVNCGTCHSAEEEQHAKSLHGRALRRKDPLAPSCANCHGSHDIVPLKDARSAVAFIRQSKGYEVIEAADGEEALERFRERRPDLVLADALMPRKNGYELCAALKGLITTRSIPFILLTGQADSADGTVKRWNPELRPDEIISKPFKIQDLVDRIAAHLPAKSA